MSGNILCTRTGGIRLVEYRDNVLYWPMRVLPSCTRVIFLATLSFSWLTAPLVWAHDVFLKPASYEIGVDKETEVIVFDGSFAESVYSITTGSVSKLQVVDSDGLRSVDTSSWGSVEKSSPLWKLAKNRNGTLSGTNLDLTSSFEYSADKRGSHVLGLTLYEFRVAIDLEHFVTYLKEEAGHVWDMEAYGFTKPDDIIRERFTKTAKAIINVARQVSDHALEPMGLLVEIVPLTHPSKTKVGESLSFQLIEDGEPLTNHPVIIGRKDDSDLHLVLHSDDEGIVELAVTASDVWWIKFIRILKAPEDDPMDFFSRWASLTFEIE